MKPKSGDKNLRLFRDSIVQGGAMQYRGVEKQVSGRIGLLALDIMQIQSYIGETDKLPMLRGGSVIVEEALEQACSIVSKEVCGEAVLFRGGGNLLAFVPFNGGSRIKKSIEKRIEELSKGGLKSAVVVAEFDLEELKEFNRVLERLQDEIDKEKNKPHYQRIIPPSSKSDICSFCFKRKTGNFNNTEICSVCATKSAEGASQKYERLNKYLNQDLLKKYNLRVPAELENIGESIAVIVVDGNMMGRIFMQTSTPAEYSYNLHSVPFLLISH